MRRLVATSVALVCVLLAVSQTSAFEKFDFEQRFFTEFGPEVKDHCLIREGGVYHLFYLRGNPAIDIGHATSPDLIHWTMLPPILSPGSWDNLALWAPQVMRSNDDYVMYYTGVNTSWAQQTGIALSHNLRDWIKLPWPVYNPNPLTWALWNENQWSNGRDPFVFEHLGQYYMLNTASTWSAQGAISLAVSDDMFAWQDIGPLYTNDSWHVLESVQLIPHNGKYHLFFTEETVFGTTHMSNPELFTGWENQSKSIIDFGHAPEVNSFDPGKWVFSRHSTRPDGQGNYLYVIRFDSLKWDTGDVPQVRRPWPLAANWTNVSGSAFSFQPTFLNNPAVRGEDVDVGFEGTSWLSSSELYQGPLGIGSPGGYLGDSQVGVIRSRTFTVTGNSIRLLVGGGDYPDDCFVALVDAGTQEVLFKETGRDSDEMDERLWDVRPYKGGSVYIEVVDNSTAPFGRISLDGIEESATLVTDGSGEGEGDRERDPIHPIGDNLPGVARLHQNNPNPFNPTTTIAFELPASGFVELDIYDVHGKRVRRLVSRQEMAGPHRVQWDGRNDRSQRLSTGIYFYRLTVGGERVDTKKMMLLK